MTVCASGCLICRISCARRQADSCPLCIGNFLSRCFPVRGPSVYHRLARRQTCDYIATQCHPWCQIRERGVCSQKECTLYCHMHGAVIDAMVGCLRQLIKTVHATREFRSDSIFSPSRRADDIFGHSRSRGNHVVEGGECVFFSEVLDPHLAVHVLRGTLT